MHTISDLSTHPDVRRVMKKKAIVMVRFAPAPGILATLEGAVAYAPGDALLTASSGESWPIGRENFMRSYTPAPPAQMGEDGAYTKLPLPVWAVQQANAFSCVLPNGSVLHCKTGDWLLEYDKNNFGVVAAHIFAETYDILS